MKLTNKARVYFAAVAAAASILSAAPVQAAETTQGIQTTEKTPAIASSGLIGLGMSGIEHIESPVTMKSGMVEQDGKVLYKDAFGQNVTGFVEKDGNQYYFGKNGEMKAGWVQANEGWYYFNEEGIRQTGTIEDDGVQYIVHEDGTLTTGWVEENGAWMYYKQDGARAQDTTLNIEGVQYTFDENGQWVKPVEKEETPQEYAENTVADADRYQMIANAAIAQIGVMQDCTMLVTNALRAVGINFHGAPYKYLSLGEVTNNPVPGDIIVYQGHVAIYIGNGRAIHGGWNGNQTIEWSVNCANPFVAYVHPRLP